MNLRLTILAACLFCAVSATAGTRDVNTTAYFVTTNQGQEITTPQGNQVTVGIQNHSNLVDHVTNEEFSQWCTGNASEAGGAGYCTIIADNGDVLWVSYLNQNGSGTWTVMGGTGEYLGATGGGTSTPGSQRGDGQAWTSTSTGTLTTK